VTGPGAFRHVKHEEEVLAQAAERIKARPLELPEKLEKLAAATRELEKEVQRLQGRLAAGSLGQILAQAQEVQGIRVVASQVDLRDAKGIRELGDRLRDQLGSGVVVLAAPLGERVAWVTMVTKDLTARLHAGNLARDLAKLTGGGGGGRPDVAEAGGKDPSRIAEALAAVPALVRGQLARA